MNIVSQILWCQIGTKPFTETSDDVMNALKSLEINKVTHNLQNFSKKSAISNYIKIRNLIINEVMGHLYTLT